MLGMSNVLYLFLSLVILITVSISSMFPKFGIQSFFALEVDINKYWLCKVGTLYEIRPLDRRIEVIGFGLYCIHID